MPTTTERIAEMRVEGIRISSEDEARVATYLESEETFQQLKAYWPLFPRHLEGKKDRGKFIDLSFDDLVRLSSLDKELRGVFLALTLRVERDTKVRLVTACAGRGDEDGYGIVEDFKAQLPYLSELERELDRRGNPEGAGFDPFVGELIHEHRKSMPIDVFAEVISFGTLVGLVRFAAVRWHDDEMFRRHYALRQVKEIRNAGSHQHSVITGLGKAVASKKGIRLGADVYAFLDNLGIRNTESRRAALRNTRMQELVCTIYAHCTAGVARDPAVESELLALGTDLKKAVRLYAPERGHAFSSYLNFLVRLIDGSLGGGA